MRSKSDAGNAVDAALSRNPALLSRALLPERLEAAEDPRGSRRGLQAQSQDQGPTWR